MAVSRVILRGTSRKFRFSIVDEDDVAVPMASRELYLRLTPVESLTPAHTLTPTYTSEVGGLGYFTLTRAQTAALTKGRYWLEIVYEDDATGERHVVYPLPSAAPEPWHVQDAKSGTL